MGLDFSHGQAHFSYSGFDRFRIKLARELSIELEEMEGYKENGISWDGIDDPIVLLLHHSDCDGELSPEACTLIAIRLRELVRNWEGDPDMVRAIYLAEGMEEAATAGEPLLFV